MNNFTRRTMPHILGAGLLLQACSVSVPTDKQADNVVVADLPQVVLDTSAGEIVLEVDSKRAPVTAANFLGHVELGAYDGGKFYRAVRLDTDRGTPPIEVIQGGRGLEFEDDIPGIAHEPTSSTGLRHLDGTISMSRSEPGSATTEFFITIGDQPALDAGGTRAADGLGFAAFGRVILGMDVVRAIQAMPANGAAPDPYVEGQMLDPVVTITTASRRKGAAK
ncbi:peptidylprolyl isomerase [Pacificimonas pallii]|nr:peptidylprolyl isomerase [Pacificimonas pallii]